MFSPTGLLVLFSLGLVGCLAVGALARAARPRFPGVPLVVVTRGAPIVSPGTPPAVAREQDYLWEGTRQLQGDIARLSPAGRHVIDNAIDHHNQFVRPGRITAEIRLLLTDLGDD